MKLKVLLIIAISILFMCASLDPANAQDSTSVKVGKGEFRIDAIPFATIIKASSDEDTQLEAKPFFGSGLSMAYKHNWYGMSASALFYSNENGTVYPVGAFGGVMYFREVVAVSLAWDFGKIGKDMQGQSEIAKRLRLMLSYNFNLIKGK